MRAGARIAAGAGGTMLHRKRTECTQLDPVATRQRGDDLIENRVHNVLDIPLVEMRVVLGDALNKFGFDHRDWDPGRFFFSSRRRHTRFDCDWSSDVCSSD